MKVLGNTIKFGVYEPSPQPYLLIASQQKDKQLTSYGYNFILTITSDSLEFNSRLEKEFMEKTQIQLRDAPAPLSRMMQNINLVLPIFKEHGELAMQVLREKA